MAEIYIVDPDTLEITEVEIGDVANLEQMDRDLTERYGDFWFWTEEEALDEGRNL